MEDLPLFIDDELANKLYLRIQNYLPQNRHISGLSNRFRFSKYVKGGKFALHQDGIYQDPNNGHRSFMTLNIFLNDDYTKCEAFGYEAQLRRSWVYTGGETDFFDGESLGQVSNRRTAYPKVGRGALFYREIFHRGNKVTDGVKYLLRTDVMSPIT